MDRLDALSALSSPDLHLRLQAARLLAQWAQPGDALRLQEALALESVTWVKTALRQAVKRAFSETKTTEPSIIREEGIVTDEVFDQIRTIAVSETTRRIVHEIAPIIGVLRLRAKADIEDFESSKTKVQIDRLQELLRAVDLLSMAAVAPTFSEVELADLIRNVVASEIASTQVSVQLAGPSTLIVTTDPALVSIVLANGIRNAIEAVELLHKDGTEAPPVVVNWGETDRDVWIAVLDRGVGPPLAVEGAFDIGNTTKRNHLGMGLPTARQAIVSLSGQISLGLRSETGGARLEFRWPRVEAVGG